MKPTVSFHTLGCKLNFAETSAIGKQLKEAGFEKKEFEEGADIVVINTCSVTENADRECRTIVRRALSKNPDSFVAVIGCYAQLKPEEISKIDGVDLVLGATEKFNLAAYLYDYSKKIKTEIHSCTINEANVFHAAYSFGDRTRAFLKVQDGCDYPCTYCTIPMARGASRSAKIQEIVMQANELAEKGISEIVLTGVNIGDYGITEKTTSKHQHNFLDLIRALDEIKQISRYRISSIEPNLLNDEIISFVAGSERFAPHFHIPLQSGSDKILRLMRRRYKSELYEERVRKIKYEMPHACIGADVIVGFPGETEEDFLETYRFLNEIDVSYLHVFTYSERANTEAASLPEVVDFAERKKRNKMLRILSEKKRNCFYTSHIGKEFEVLFEEENRNGYMSGYTENYIRLKRPFDSGFTNKPVKIRIEPGDCLTTIDAVEEITA
jgi:threonylcarbamoyladenosine tRNA methylthiotransferase MtaB